MFRAVVSVNTGGARRLREDSFGEENRTEVGEQQWPDGSRYEGEFVNGLKHGWGKYTSRNGQCYEGSFYKDFKHGDGVYYWPSGHKFVGKFYLDRKEGYAQHFFPDGSHFQGLYYRDQRFGPGVFTYPNGQQDVGLWHNERLIQLCTALEGFTLQDFPEYAAFMTSPTDAEERVPLFNKSQKYINQSIDDCHILPPGIEYYSTDGDHLPLPPGRRKELDQLFFGEQWEPDAKPYQGYKRDPLSALPLEARMKANIEKHRLQSKNLTWDVDSVLALKRTVFGPKGPLELRSELLIHLASQGQHKAVAHTVYTGQVHPDVADALKYTALMAAVVNCHNDVINVLLNMGVNIDKLNHENMSALAICHVLYYPFHSLFTVPQNILNQAKEPQTSDLTKDDTQEINARFDSMESVQTHSLVLSEAAEAFVEDITCHSEGSREGELLTEHGTELAGPQTPTENECHSQDVTEETQGQRTQELETEIKEEVHEITKEVHEITEEVHEMTEEVHKVTEEVLVITEEVHEIAEEVHEITEEVHENREEVYEILEEVHEITLEVHEITGEVHEIMKEVPEITEDVHEITEEVPEITEEVSEITEEVSEITEEVPEMTEEIHEIIEKDPEIIEEVSEITEEVPEITEEIHEIIEEDPEIIEEDPEIREEVHEITKEVHPPEVHIEQAQSSAGYAEDDTASDPNEREQEEGNIKDAVAVDHSIDVLDGKIVVGSVQWTEYPTKLQAKAEGKSETTLFDSTESLINFPNQVTEKAVHLAAEALSRTGITPSQDTQETVHKMAAMKMEHRERLSTLNLLLDRGADPNACKVPMPVLFLAIMASDVEAVKRLLFRRARTDIPLPPERKGLYPLHVAAGLPGPEGPKITELLFHAIPDPDARACDADEIFKVDRENSIRATVDTMSREGGKTALHVACIRDYDFMNASKIVALLLSHGARTDLLWSGHSPLSLAIACRNELAMEELLKGGADPNIPLGNGVGSALCALVGNNSSSCNSEKLLDMLVKAGADIQMPVLVNNVEGTAVDYAYFCYHQDKHISRASYHLLNLQEKNIYKDRQQLLKMMVNVLRKTATKREKERQSAGSQTPGGRSLHSFCYYCCRSVFVKLTKCSRCQLVSYCSKSCKLKSWAEGHKDECMSISRMSSKQSSQRKAKGAADAAQNGNMTAQNKKITSRRGAKEAIKMKALQKPFAVVNIPKITTSMKFDGKTKSLKATDVSEEEKPKENYSYI